MVVLYQTDRLTDSFEVKRLSNVHLILSDQKRRMKEMLSIVEGLPSEHDTEVQVESVSKTKYGGNSTSS